MSFLAEILARKRERLNAAKEIIPFDAIRELGSAVRSSSPAHRFRAALEVDAINIIAEFKRRSPSKGIIRGDVAAETVVRSYEAGGAAAISVLTEQDYFDGSLDDLRTVKAATSLAVLRKDFLFDEYQVFEAAAAGADAILLIVAAINDETLLHLRHLAEAVLQMDALVEVHDDFEMHRAASAGATLIGVNNRNLHTFEVSLATSMRLAALAPDKALLISESGLRSATDLIQLKQVGYSGFLIGEALMRSDDPELALRRLVEAVR